MLFILCYSVTVTIHILNMTINTVERPPQPTIALDHELPPPVTRPELTSGSGTTDGHLIGLEAGQDMPPINHEDDANRNREPVDYSESMKKQLYSIRGIIDLPTDEKTKLMKIRDIVNRFINKSPSAELAPQPTPLDTSSVQQIDSLYQQAINILQTTSQFETREQIDDLLEGVTENRSQIEPEVRRRVTEYIRPVTLTKNTIDDAINQQIQNGELSPDQIDDVVEKSLTENGANLSPEQQALLKTRVASSTERYKKDALAKMEAMQKAKVEQAEREKQAELKKREAEELIAKKDKEAKEVALHNQQANIKASADEITTNIRQDHLQENETLEQLQDRHITAHHMSNPHTPVEEQAAIAAQVRQNAQIDTVALRISDEALQQFSANPEIRYDDAEMGQQAQALVDVYIQNHPEAAQLDRPQMIQRTRERIQRKLTVQALASKQTFTPSTDNFIKKLPQEQITQQQAPAPNPEIPPTPPPDKPTEQPPNPQQPDQNVIKSEKTLMDEATEEIIGRKQGSDLHPTDVDMYINYYIKLHKLTESNGRIMINGIPISKDKLARNIMNQFNQQHPKPGLWNKIKSWF